MRRTLLFSLAWPVLTLGAPAALGQPDAEAARDEAALRSVGLKTDDDALLQFFRSRTPSPAQREQFRALVKQLGSPAYGERARATSALVQMGPRIKPLLADVKKQTHDQETVRRAELC